MQLREELNDTLVSLRRENLKILHELVDSQRYYQDILRSTLAEQQLKIAIQQQRQLSYDQHDKSNVYYFNKKQNSDSSMYIVIKYLS